MQSHHATFWDGSSCSTCLVPLQSLIEAFGSMCGHLLNGVWSAWSVSDSAPPLQVFTHLCLNHAANFAFSKLAFQGCWLSSSARKMNRTLRVLRPELPPSRALKLSPKEPLIRHSQAAPWLFRLCGAQMMVPRQEIGGPWQHFDSGESIVLVGQAFKIYSTIQYRFNMI